MREDRNNQAFYIIGNHEVAPFNVCKRLSRVVESEASERAYPEIQNISIARSPHDPDQIVDKRLVDAYFSHFLLQLQDAVTVHHRHNSIHRGVESLLAKNRLFILAVRITHPQPHHEPVKL